MSTYAVDHRSCEKKARYKNARQAYRAADVAAQRQGRVREALRAYECDRCHHWHLTKLQGEH